MCYIEATPTRPPSEQTENGLLIQGMIGFSSGPIFSSFLFCFRRYLKMEAYLTLRSIFHSVLNLFKIDCEPVLNNEGKTLRFQGISY